jgi:hypothetical protein
MSDLEERLGEALDRLAALENRVERQKLHGRVVQRDHEKGVRLQLGGTDENPFLSPWIRPGDRSGVTSYLPDIGEQGTMHAPDGVWENAAYLPFTHHDERKNPARDADETVIINHGGVRISARNGKLEMYAKEGIFERSGNSTRSLTKDGHVLSQKDGDAPEDLGKAGKTPPEEQQEQGGEERSYSLLAAGHKLKKGEVEHVLDSEGNEFVKGKVRHNKSGSKRNIGADHKHADVMTGPDKTGDPEEG